MRKGYVVLLILIFSVYLNCFTSPAISSNNHNRVIRILSVCSDLEDVVFTYNLVEELEHRGYDIDVEILYLSKNYPGASDERKLLSDIWYLRKFDQIWLLDLNVLMIIDGSLKPSELDNILKACREGRLVVIGMNTYVQNYSPSFDKLLGIRLLNAYGSLKETYYIRGLGYNLEYNASACGIAFVENVSSKVLAVFEPSGKPAITIKKYGNGIAAFLAFNPVKQAIEYNSTSYYSLLAEAITESMSMVGPRIFPPFYEYYVHRISERFPLIVLTILSVSIVFAFLEILAYLGLLPYSMILIFIAPGVLLLKKRIRSSRRFEDIYLVIRDNPGISIDELSVLTGISRRRLKYYLAVLENAGMVRSLIIPYLGVGRIFVCRGMELEGIIYRLAYTEGERIINIIVKEPGITVSELAARTGLPIDRVLQIIKRLAAYGVIELRRAGTEYEAYPTKKLVEVLAR